MVQKKSAIDKNLVGFDDFSNFKETLSLKNRKYRFKHFSERAEFADMGKIVEVYSKYPDIRKQKSN